MPEFMGSWWFMILMVLILIALVGVLLYMRNKRPED
jgi:LPXTG-motif cell wall-anchored protein